MSDLFTLIKEAKINTPILISVLNSEKNYFVFCSKSIDEIKISSHENDSKELSSDFLKGAKYFFNNGTPILGNRDCPEILIDINGLLSKNKNLEYLVGSMEVNNWINNISKEKENFLSKIYRSLILSELKPVTINHYPHKTN